MTTLTVRNVDDDLKARLRVRAAQNGHSMEAEVREILRQTLVDRPRTGLGTWIHEQFSGLDVELDIPARTDVPRSADLPE